MNTEAQKAGRLRPCVVFYIILAAAAVIFPTIFFVSGQKEAGVGFLFWCCVVFGLFISRPSSLLHKLRTDNMGVWGRVLTLILLISTIAVCILPMSLSPYWNGEIPGHRNQYEKLAESILDGHVYLDYGDDTSALEALENPYDPAKRTAAHVRFRWDHVWYNSHYYMYFGVVPVFLIFIPFRLITGQSLTTYHATQVFVAAAIIGFFMLFYLLAKAFFPKMSLGTYLALSCAFSILSLWYSTSAPALYCTAITSAICMEIWSLYFFFRAVYAEQKENRQILLAGIGALFGALAFGCRPPIALVNIIVLPLLYVFLRQRKFSTRLLGKLALAAMPYFVIGAALMYYNYIRFGNPFEFGQTYQLTVADQTQYSSFADAFDLSKQLNGMLENFLGLGQFTSEFPYVRYSGALINFPILCLSAGVIRTSVFRQLKEKKLLPAVIALFMLPLIITFIDVLWSPYLMERYRLDIYFIMSILCFMIVGFWYNSVEPQKQNAFGCFIMAASIFTAIYAFILFCVPYDGNAAQQCTGMSENIEQALFFWRYIK